MVTSKAPVDWSGLYHGPLTWVPERTIFLTRAGSHAYGLATPESDLDLRGVVIPPKEYFLGFAHHFEQAESHDPDLVLYDIRKFFALAAACNPSILELLWAEPEDHLLVTALGRRLLEHRTAFLSRRVRHTFSGYAVAQLKRIKTHRRWLTQPPTHKPTRAEFGLPETSLLSADILGAIEAVERAAVQDLSAFPAHVMDLYRRERAYQNALREWHQYEQWKAHRNPKRAALEAKVGYDCKHAMHLVRLMRSCREILTTGQVVVKRPDRDELLAIRDGAWSYEQLIQWSEQEDQALEAVAQRSPLPERPDRQKLDSLCIAMVEEAIGLIPSPEGAVAKSVEIVRRPHPTD
ncbi:MAG: nucleotidyltransferase domain-containing protein [Thermodesulfobacteriota bacterium]|jgi:predicted nucleotidyltransferase